MEDGSGNVEPVPPLEPGFDRDRAAWERDRASATRDALADERACAPGAVTTAPNAENSTATAWTRRMP